MAAILTVRGPAILPQAGLDGCKYECLPERRLCKQLDDWQRHFRLPLPFEGLDRREYDPRCDVGSFSFLDVECHSRFERQTNLVRECVLSLCPHRQLEW